jgi:TonB family protein
MGWRLIFAGILAVIAPASEVVVPSRLYIVSEFFSDNGAAFYYRLIDVHQDGPDSVVRYSRVAHVNIYCPRMVVQSAEARLPGKSISDLIETTNPCAIQPRAFRAALKDYATRGSVLETISFGLVASCRSSDVVFELPIPEKVDMNRLKREHPNIANLWNLASFMTDAAFGLKDIFHDRTEDDDMTLQRAGEKIVPELMSGTYDAGLTAAVKGGVGEWKSPSFRGLLEDYRGPVSATEANRTFTAQLLNSSEYKFDHYVTPKYPPLAQQAQIQGKVELQLALNPSTGEVVDVSAISGHQLLARTAIDAAKQWRFRPESLNSEMLRATLSYEPHCP